MTQFAATFSNGQTITRNSDHAYAFAWAIVRIADGKIEESGFSADRANAAKAALAKKRGFATLAAFYADAEASAAAYHAARRSEIVPVN